MSSPLARSFSLLAFAVGAALPLPALSAQAVAPRLSDPVVRTPQITITPSRTSADSLPQAGPRVTRAGVSAALAVEAIPAVPQGSDAHVGAGSNVALMGVGLAGILIGSLVGGDGGTIIAVGGGVIGLIGLFRYLR